MATFTLDAEVLPRRFSADAFIMGSGRWKHSRQHDHFGPESDLYVVLSQPIGGYAQYTPIHYVLEDLLNRATSLTSSTKRFGSFDADAVVEGAHAIIIDSIVESTASSSVTIDATMGQGLSFTIDSMVRRLFTVDAFLL